MAAMHTNILGSLRAFADEYRRLARNADTLTDERRFLTFAAEADARADEIARRPPGAPPNDADTLPLHGGIVMRRAVSRPQYRDTMPHLARKRTDDSPAHETEDRRARLSRLAGTHLSARAERAALSAAWPALDPVEARERVEEIAEHQERGA